MGAEAVMLHVAMIFNDNTDDSATCINTNNLF
jgi:hypothetical protein